MIRKLRVQEMDSAGCIDEERVLYTVMLDLWKNIVDGEKYRGRCKSTSPLDWSCVSAYEQAAYFMALLFFLASF